MHLHKFLKSKTQNRREQTTGKMLEQPIHDSDPHPMNRHKHVDMRYAQMSKLKDTKTHEQSTEKIAEQKLYDSDPQSMNRHKRIYIRGLSEKFVDTCNFIQNRSAIFRKVS